MENTMRTDITKINEKSPHTELTEGLMVFAGGTSKMFQTGEWRTNTPIFHEDLCKQCLLCALVCPDVSIPVKDSKRGAFDYDQFGLTFRRKTYLVGVSFHLMPRRSTGSNGMPPVAIPHNG